MKAKEVLKVLKVTRPTLTSYVQRGLIKTTQLTNGFYDYDEDSVLALAGITAERGSAVYARVSTAKQKNDLHNQIDTVIRFANERGYKVSKVYSDIASGLSYDRGQFAELLNEVLEYKWKTVFVENKDRFTRVSFDMWKELFAKFGCTLISINDEVSPKGEDEEIFADIISILHCFAMRMYSSRRKKKLELMKEDLENEISV